MDFTTIGELALAQIGRHPTFNSGSVENLIGSTEPLLIPGFGFRRNRATAVPLGTADPEPVDGPSDTGSAKDMTSSVPRIFRLVNAGAFGSFDIREARLGRVALDLKPRMAERVERHLLREGDVVVSLEPPFRVAVASRECEGALVGDGFAIVRLDDEAAHAIDRHYLSLWLSSTQVRAVLGAKLDARAGGASGRSLEVGDLFDVPVPLAAPGMQRALARLFTVARERECSYWDAEELALRLGDLACASVAGDVDGDLDTEDGPEALRTFLRESAEARGELPDAGADGESELLDAVDELISCFDVVASGRVDDGETELSMPMGQGDGERPVDEGIATDAAGADKAAAGNSIASNTSEFFLPDDLIDLYHADPNAFYADVMPVEDEPIHYEDGYLPESMAMPGVAGPMLGPSRSPPMETGFGSFGHTLD